MTAPPVHVAAEQHNCVATGRLKGGKIRSEDCAGGQSAEKTFAWGVTFREFRPSVCAGSSGIVCSRRRNRRCRKMVRSIDFDQLSDRNIEIAGYGMNWIWLFFILSMVGRIYF